MNIDEPFSSSFLYKFQVCDRQLLLMAQKKNILNFRVAFVTALAMNPEQTGLTLRRLIALGAPKVLWIELISESLQSLYKRYQVTGTIEPRYRPKKVFW